MPAHVSNHITQTVAVIARPDQAPRAIKPLTLSRVSMMDRVYRAPRFFRDDYRRILSGVLIMIRKLKTGQYRLYSRKTNPKTGKRRNLGTFSSRAAAEKHERAVQYFKRH